jgi:hypothetical protein
MQRTLSNNYQQHKRVEKFLREIGIEPAESTSRNPLEQVWSLSEEESAREETISVMEEIGRVESAIDEKVKGLYGL